MHFPFSISPNLRCTYTGLAAFEFNFLQFPSRREIKIHFFNIFRVLETPERLKMNFTQTKCNFWRNCVLFYAAFDLKRSASADFWKTPETNKWISSVDSNLIFSFPSFSWKIIFNLFRDFRTFWDLVLFMHLF